MAATFDDLKRFMEASGLSHDAHDEAEAITVGFHCDPDDTTYRDEDGDPCVQIFMKLDENGEFLVVSAISGWDMSDCDHVPAACEAVARLQSIMKLIRFDLDKDGVLRPNVELALEKAPLCAEQLHRSIASIMRAIRYSDPVIRHAMDTGTVDLTLANGDETVLEPDAEPDSQPAPDMGRILDLANEAGGLDALDRLLGGDGAPPVEA